MEISLSLRNGKLISASNCDHSSSRSLLLVCPECGEPVYFKKRHIPYQTSFFAHHKESESVKLLRPCTIRSNGGIFSAASEFVHGISHGQLVDKFQKEFCKELFESFGGYSDLLGRFIKDSQFERMDNNSYRSFISHIRSNYPVSEILEDPKSYVDIDDFGESIEDVSLFLNSAYGIWVGNFIYQVAYFVAVTIHESCVDNFLKNRIFSAGEKKALFIGDISRLEKIHIYADEILPANSSRNLSIDDIAATLVSFLILKWKQAKKLPKLYIASRTLSTLSRENTNTVNTSHTPPPKQPSITTPTYKRPITPAVKEIPDKKYFLRWYKTNDGIGDKKTDTFFSYFRLLRDMVPYPGYTTEDSLFIKDSDIETPAVEGDKAVVTCPDCGKKCRVSNIKKLQISCPSCLSTWTQRLF
jgi:hypothetical protein